MSEGESPKEMDHITHWSWLELPSGVIVSLFHFQNLISSARIIVSLPEWFEPLWKGFSDLFASL